MKRKIARIILCATLASSFVVGAAFAADLQTFTFLASSTWSANAITMNYSGLGNIWAGQYQGTLGSKQVGIFCTDFAHTISTGSPNNTYSTLVSLGTITAAAAPAVKIGTDYYYATGSAGNYVGGGIQSAFNASDYNPKNLTTAGFLNSAERSSAVAYLADTYLKVGLTKQQYAGVQSAIWDIVTDGGDGLAAGTVKALRANQSADGKAAFDYSASYITEAKQHLSYTTQTALWIQDGSSTRASDGKSRNTHLQDFVYEGPKPNDNPPPTPEPMSMVLVGTGLSAVAGLRRRMGKA